MAKRELLLNESTTRRFMKLANIPALTNSFLTEQSSVYEEGGEEPDYGLDEGGDDEYGLDEGGEDLKDLMNELEGYEEDPEASDGLKENIRKTARTLKRLLEQAEVEDEAEDDFDSELPEPESDTELEAPPEMGGEDELESKVKDFVRKMAELVQDTLGVEVSVEDGDDEPEMDEPEMDEPEMDEPEPEPEAMQEALNRLVNKIAKRVQARLVEGRRKAQVTRVGNGAKKKTAVAPVKRKVVAKKRR